MADNLAHFSYQVMDEPLYVIHQADSIISISGQNILSSFKRLLTPVLKLTQQQQESSILVQPQQQMLNFTVQQQQQTVGAFLAHQQQISTTTSSSSTSFGIMGETNEDDDDFTVQVIFSKFHFFDKGM